MNAIRIFRAADAERVAWKNGGGLTREIAVFPAGASIDDFQWRLSMAWVETAGAFSAFPGVDRTLAVLSGALRLSSPEVDVALDELSPPFAFDGGAAVTGAPLAGAVLDLNAMTRRGEWSAAMTRLAAGDRILDGDGCFVVALTDQIFGADRLCRLDAAHVQAPAVAAGPLLQVAFTKVPTPAIVRR